MEQKDLSRIAEIERLMGEDFPDALRPLFEKYDGEGREGFGAFLGHIFLSLEQIAARLQGSQEFVKPETPVVPDQAEAERILSAIAEIVMQTARVRTADRPGGPGWHKITFEVGPGSLRGPYLYREETTTGQDHEILGRNREEKSLDRDGMQRLVRELHALERDAYNWDNLEFQINADGSHVVDRQFHDLAKYSKSRPEGAIRIKYYHVKWLPLIHDGGNNFIGIDLAPGPNGVRGQVIVFGRDEDEMFVIDNTWEAFLDRVLRKIDEGGAQFIANEHLHDLFRQEIVS